MNDAPSGDRAGGLESVAARVDRACDRFEEAWLAGQRPRLKDYLDTVPQTERRELLHELLRLEVVYRRWRGEEPQAEEYQSWFPEMDGRWLADLLSSSAATMQRDPPLVATVPLTTPPPPSAPGLAWTRLGRFSLRHELGRGSFGIVFLAEDLELRRQVALKVLRPEVVSQPEFRDRFLREAQAAARLDHPNLVPVHEVGVEGTVPYLVSAYCPGLDLAAWLRQQPEPVPFHLAARLVATLADAVQHAHERGVVHRDLKPSNVLLQPRNETPPGEAVPGDLAWLPRLTDFGLARIVAGAPTDPAANQQTQTGLVLGTPCYMAPEQARGKGHEAGPAADTYALGAILYELLTGRPPFRGETIHDTLWLVQSSEPIPPSTLRPRLPRDLQTICLKCLQKEPRKRYPSARELGDDLRRFLTSEPIRARPVTALERGWRWCRRHPAVAGLLTLIGVMAGTGAVLISSFALEADRQRWAALGSLAEARQQREAAEEQARVADAERLSARRHLYAANMNLTLQALEDGRLWRVPEMLAGQQPDQTGGEDLRGFEWYHLQRRCAAALAVKTHDAVVLSVAYSPDGKYLASCERDGVVRLWDATTEQSIRVFGEDKKHGARDVAFSPDSRYLACAGRYNQVEVWDVRTGQVFGSFRASGSFPAVAYRPDGQRLAAAAGDKTVKIWDTARPGKPDLLRGHSSGVVGVAYSPDGKYLASASLDRTVKLWDAVTGREVRTLSGHKDAVRGVALSPDSARLASASEDRTGKVWDVARGEELFSLQGHTDGVRGVAFDPDGTRLTTASADRTVKVWDARTGTERFTLHGHANEVHKVAYRPDGRRLATAGHEWTMRVWDARIDPAGYWLEGHTAQALAVAFSPDGRRLATGSRDQTAAVWDASGKRLLVLGGDNGSVNHVAFSLDGKQLAGACGDGTVRLWNALEGKPLLTLRGHTGSVGFVAFSPEGRHLASASNDQTVRLWDVPTGQQVRLLTGHTGGVHGVAFSPDGALLASASTDLTVKVWDSATGKELFSLAAATQFMVCRVVFSPDGKLLVTGGHDGTLRVWDARTGKPILRSGRPVVVKGYTMRVFGLAFDPAGKRLASAWKDGKVIVWDTATWQQTIVLKRLNGEGRSVAFSPDGQRLASAGGDFRGRGEVFVWEATPWER